MCLNADSEACGCGIDMVDGALETLDLTLYERGIVRFSSENFFPPEGKNAAPLA